MKKLMMMGLLALMAMTMTTACHDDDELQPAPDGNTGAWTVSVVTADDDDEPMCYWRASYESITVSIAGRTSNNPILVSIDIDDTADRWLTVASDTLPADSIVALKTKQNNTGQRRTATLRFTDATDPSISGTLEVTQQSQSDVDANGEDARALLYVGYGYDIYKALESPMAVRCKAPIIDQERLRQHTSRDRYELIHDSRLSRTEMRYVASNDIRAYGRDLTTQQTGDAEHQIQGCTDNCQTAVDNIDPAKGKLEQQNFGHGSLEKVVYSRVIDRGALMDLRRAGAMGFTDEFNARLHRVYNTEGEERKKLIENLMLEYGTHIVIQADLGGRIDYTFTMSKLATFDTEEDMRQEVDYTMGRISDSDRTTINRTTSSNKSAEGAITVMGGSAASRQALQGDIDKLSPTKQMDPTHLTDWLSSINYSPNPEQDPNLDVIHFELMPLWDLVGDELRQDFLDVTIKMASRSDCKLPASFLGTDIYEIEPEKEPDLFQFENVDDQTTLCRLLYFEDQPVLQVCSEYVPKIRSDQRVTIAYPIYKQNIRMNEGLFIGDGIHQPAVVAFSQGRCHVNPIDTMPAGSKIEKFYYVNGFLSLVSPVKDESARAALKGKQRVVRDETFYYRIGGTTYRHPIVKIGSKFWTRNDIYHRMGFTNTPNASSTRTFDIMRDDLLYARYWHDIARNVRPEVSWTWGSEQNDFFPDKPFLKWYFPKGTDVTDLYEYVGFNTKALFRGQIAGYNAEFNGYYGSYDFINDRSFNDGDNMVRYQGKINCFASRNSTGDTEAVLLILDTNYKIVEIKEGKQGHWRENYFPVRPCRGYNFTYPLLSVIDSHQ